MKSFFGPGAIALLTAADIAAAQQTPFSISSTGELDLYIHLSRFFFLGEARG
jgi:hypothetical protein